MTPFPSFPALAGATHRLSRAGVPRCLIAEPSFPLAAGPDGLVLADLAITDGRITAVTPAADQAADGALDLGGSQVWPAFVDLHTHLDKGHILPRARNPDGTVYGAVRSVAVDRALHWSAAEVRTRFEFGLRCAYAHGTRAIRTHLDCDAPQDEISWPIFAELRSAWAGRIELQAVGKYPLDLFLTPRGEAIARTVAHFGGILGAVSVIPGRRMADAAPQIEAALDALFTLAVQHDLDVDLHVDESGDPADATLGLVARAAIKHGHYGRVVCGHCCSLAVQDSAAVEPTLALCAEARLAVVTLPMINQYLQGRGAGTTPRWRGVTLVHELARHGIPVALASDNCRDPFFAFGDHDMLEVFTQSVRIAHLDLPGGDWPRAATAVPATLMGLSHPALLQVGTPADLVLFRARTPSELLSRPQSDRVVLRAGRAIDPTLPDYRELDSLFHP